MFHESSVVRKKNVYYMLSNGSLRMKTSVLALFIVCLVTIFGLSMVDIKINSTKVQKILAAEPFLNKALLVL